MPKTFTQEQIYNTAEDHYYEVEDSRIDEKTISLEVTTHFGDCCDGCTEDGHTETLWEFRSEDNGETFIIIYDNAAALSAKDIWTEEANDPNA